MGAARVVEGRLTEDSLVAGLAKRDEVVTCQRQGEVCEVKRGGMFISEMEVLERSDHQASVKLVYRVPTPRNTMGRMCPKVLRIELVAEVEVWRAVEVLRLNAC